MLPTIIIVKLVVESSYVCYRLQLFNFIVMKAVYCISLATGFGCQFFYLTDVLMLLLNIAVFLVNLRLINLVDNN